MPTLASVQSIPLVHPLQQTQGDVFSLPACVCVCVYVLSLPPPPPPLISIKVLVVSAQISIDGT